MCAVLQWAALAIFQVKCAHSKRMASAERHMATVQDNRNPATMLLEASADPMLLKLVSRPGALASPEYLLEMQLLRFDPKPTESKCLGRDPAICVLPSPLVNADAHPSLRSICQHIHYTSFFPILPAQFEVCCTGI